MLSLSSFDCASPTLHNRSFRVFNSLSTSDILKTFGSVKSFARELENYLHSTGHNVNSDSSSASGRSEKSHSSERKADRRERKAVLSDSYESWTSGDQTDDEALEMETETEVESKRSLDAIRISFVRGDKISDEECTALERVHLRRMALTAEGRVSRGVSPIRRAYEALQENNSREKSGVVGGLSDSQAGLDPLIETALSERDPGIFDSGKFASSSSSSSSSGSGRGRGSHQEKERIGGNVDRDRGRREGGGSGMDHNILDEFLNGYQDGPDAYVSRERGPILLSKLLSVFRRCRGSHLPSFLSHSVLSAAAGSPYLSLISYFTFVTTNSQLAVRRYSTIFQRRSESLRYTHTS
jgi:hypothetical protein